jgi:hypothetical protein
MNHGVVVNVVYVQSVNWALGIKPFIGRLHKGLCFSNTNWERYLVTATFMSTNQRKQPNYATASCGWSQALRQNRSGQNMFLRDKFCSYTNDIHLERVQHNTEFWNEIVTHRRAYGKFLFEHWSPEQSADRRVWRGRGCEVLWESDGEGLITKCLVSLVSLYI